MTKILIVEDDTSLAEIYKIRLEADGYSVITANDGEAGLAMAIHEKPDLILSDIMMPRVSGFDMLDILKTTPNTAGIKVVVMTALSGEDQHERGTSLGADAYLVKSQVGIEDVVETIRKVLTGEGGASATTVQLNPNKPTPETVADPIVVPMPQPTVVAQPATESTAVVSGEVEKPAVDIEPTTPAVGTVPTEEVKAPITEVAPAEETATPSIEAIENATTNGPAVEEPATTPEPTAQ